MRQQSSIINIKISLVILKSRSERKIRSVQKFRDISLYRFVKKKILLLRLTQTSIVRWVLYSSRLLSSLSRGLFWSDLARAGLRDVTRIREHGYVRNRATPAFLDGLDKRDPRVHVLARFAARNEIDWCLWNEGDSARLFAWRNARGGWRSVRGSRNVPPHYHY